MRLTTVARSQLPSRSMRGNRREELRSLIRDSPLPPDEVMAVLDWSFPSASLPSGSRTIELENDDREVVARVTIRKDGQLDADFSDGLPDETAAQITARLSAAQQGVLARWTETYFAQLPVTTYWRYKDEWQIRPVPVDAPRPSFVAAPHPFLVEAMGLQVGDSVPMLDFIRSRKRLREIELLLAVLLREGLQAASAGASHVWVVETEPEPHSALRQAGYWPSAPGDALSSLSDVAGIDLMSEVDDETYFSQRGIGAGDTMTIPASMARFVEASQRLSPDESILFFRSAYWFSRSGPVWSVSTSLSYIALINALEVLTATPKRDPCPTCSLDRAPGPTARFRDLVETYAGAFPDHDELYRLRSALVHGRHLLGADSPWRMWLHPKEAEERHRHESAYLAARIVILNWLVSRIPSGDEAPAHKPVPTQESD